LTVAGEIPQLDDSALLYVQVRELIQCLVERDDIHIHLLRKCERFIQGQGQGIAAALGGTAAAGVFDQNLPHDVCRNPKEMRPVLPLRRTLPRQSQIRLMYQGRTLQGVIASRLTQVMMRQPLLHTNGKIYGLASHGGSHTAYGMIYSLDAGLSPFASQFVIYSGNVGTSIGILGQGFSNATGVKFGTDHGTFVASTDAFMTATVAAGANTGKITVLEPGGNLVTPQMFKVIPTISKFSPTSGLVGTQVVITGVSLTQASSVTFGGVKATSFAVNSDTQLTATVPTGAKTGKIVVKTKGGSATAPGTFTVQ
jgi:IPT/TIG domain